MLHAICACGFEQGNAPQSFQTICVGWLCLHLFSLLLRSVLFPRSSPIFDGGLFVYCLLRHGFAHLPSLINFLGGPREGQCKGSDAMFLILQGGNDCGIQHDLITGNRIRQDFSCAALGARCVWSLHLASCSVSDFSLLRKVVVLKEVIQATFPWKDFWQGCWWEQGILRVDRVQWRNLPRGFSLILKNAKTATMAAPEIEDIPSMPKFPTIRTRKVPAGLEIWAYELSVSPICGERGCWDMQHPSLIYPTHPA